MVDCVVCGKRLRIYEKKDKLGNDYYCNSCFDKEGYVRNVYNK